MNRIRKDSRRIIPVYLSPEAKQALEKIKNMTGMESSGEALRATIIEKAETLKEIPLSRKPIKKQQNKDGKGIEILGDVV